MLAQLSGQGRLALGAILGAATAALFLVGITTGPEVTVGRAELPLAMTGVPGTGDLAAPPGGSSVTAVLSATIAATTTARTATPRTTTVTGPTSVPTTTTTSPTTTTAPPTTTSRPTRTRRPPTRPPCFLFC
ncbi:MAG TPA: hypothetical protein VGL06_05785 [Pseudonocardiaceae bacterium]